MTRRVAFIAISQAHQFPHWLPVALRLARQPGLEVTVFCSTRAGIDFISSYDPDGTLRIKRLWAPSLGRQGLFSPPKRRLTLLLNAWRFARYPTIVTTDATSSLLKRLPGFRSSLVYLMHGAGDREGGYNPKLARFDLVMVNGPKDKQRLIDRGIVDDENCVAIGYAKFEVVRPPQTRLFPNSQPIALYNSHFDEQLGTYVKHGEALVREMERIRDWNFVVAPHVKLTGGPEIRSSAPNVIIDRGSVRSIDMSYTEAASVYIGDISSQLYEFLHRPRPCIFLNLDRIDWRGHKNYVHFQLGQVIEKVEDLGPALARATALQPQFEALQKEMTEHSLDPSPVPSSERQARAILGLIEYDREVAALR